MKPSVALSTILAGFLVVMIVGFGIYRWVHQRSMADARVELANARAAADTLRLVASAKGDSIRLWERRARILTDDLGDKVKEFGVLRDRLKRADREAQVLASMYVEIRDTRVLESTVTAGRDSTTIAFAHADSVFRVSGRTTFPGRIAPDPQPPALTALEIRAVVRTLMSVSCDEEGAPHAEIQTLDPRLTALDLSVSVARRVSCIPPKPGILDLVPKPTLGTGLVGAAAFLAGMIFGGQ